MTPGCRDLPARATDCLKLIYKHRERGERVTTSAMRQRLQGLEPTGQLSDASVTQLFKSLAEQGLVRHTPYKGVELTEEGIRVAAELVRHHRLLELFLVRVLGYGLDTADAEAERLEHAISEEFEERVDALLGYPTEDPHGDPIPSRTGEVVAVPETSPLNELASGQSATVRRIMDDDAEMLRYLTSLGVLPGTQVRVLEHAPFGGPIYLTVGDGEDSREHAVGPRVAASVRVEVIHK